VTERRQGEDPETDEGRRPRAPGEVEAEPDWAERIREGRKARGNRLREIFETFDEEPEERA
jgi:hypothetical protein